MNCTLNKTLKKGVNLSHSQTHMKKIKSSDDLNRTSELSITDVKILLSCNHCKSPQEEYLHQIKKQEVL